MLRITDRADLAVIYEADAVRYRRVGPSGKEDPYIDVVTCDAFVAFYADSPSIGFEMDGRPIGGILFDGAQAHIAVLPEYHGRWALLLKPALQWLFSLKDDILVDVESDNKTCLRFMDRHRWQRVKETPSDITYRLRPQGGARKTDYAISKRHQ